MCSFNDLLVYRLSNDSQLRTSLMVGEFRSEALLELLGLGQTSNFSWDEPNLGVSVKRGVYLFFKECCFRVRIKIMLGLHCKSERSVLAQKIGLFRWVKYSPIFESNLAPLNQGQCSPVSYGWFAPRAEMGPTVGCNSLLIELFWPRLFWNGSRKAWIRLWPAGLNWHFGAETDLFNFQCSHWLGEATNNGKSVERRYNMDPLNNTWRPALCWWLGSGLLHPPTRPGEDISP